MPLCRTLLDYNFEIVSNPPSEPLLVSLVNIAQIIEPSIAYENSKIIDLTRFNSKSVCEKCRNTFLVKINLEKFVCEECKKGNLLEKKNACWLQVLVKDNPATRKNSNDFMALFSDRNLNVSPGKGKVGTRDGMLLNILMPNSLDVKGGEGNKGDVLDKVEKIMQKAKFVQKDCITVLEEMKKIDVDRVDEIQRSIEEYAKRARIILNELNEFIPEYSGAVETIFKGFVKIIDGIVGSHLDKVKELLQEKQELRGKIVDQKVLRNEIKRLKMENLINVQRYSEENENLRKNIESYKYTITLYKKELDVN